MSLRTSKTGCWEGLETPLAHYSCVPWDVIISCSYAWNGDSPVASEFDKEGGEGEEEEPEEQKEEEEEKREERGEEQHHTNIM